MVRCYIITEDLGEFGGGILYTYIKEAGNKTIVVRIIPEKVSSVEICEYPIDIYLGDQEFKRVSKITEIFFNKIYEEVISSIQNINNNCSGFCLN